jgi:adenylate cyclase
MVSGMSRRSLAIPLWLAIVVVGAASGMAYKWMFRPDGDLFVAAIYGISIAAFAIGYERQLILPRLSQRLRQWPTPIYILSSEALLIVLVAIGNTVGGSLAWLLGLVGHLRWTEVVILPLQALLYSLAITAIFVFVSRMRDLLGADVFRNLMLGRYHRPTQEERVFLFIDIVGSTAYAESHGDLRAQEYIGAIFAAFAESVRRHRGAIDDYIGDLAIITWPLARGIQDAACLACLIDIRQAIASDAEFWRKRFGQVPQLRAALHGGPIVTAEIGVDRHKIAYFGDVVNTTARLEALSRSLDEATLISSELLARLPALSRMVTARPLGAHAIRGRDQTLAITALDFANLDSATRMTMSSP